jgi:hypothetical protein
LSDHASGDLKKEIDKQIKLAYYGELGEKNIIFELKNSGIDMCVLHDIYMEYGDMSAQIDFIIITRKVILVVECKNLIGNIEIDNSGNFIRNYELFGKKVKEGIYSPITQNERHLRVLKAVRMESIGNFISKHRFEAGFDEMYKSIVVLANPKTYLNARFAKKEVKDRVIRADQLVALITMLNNISMNKSLTEKEMIELGEFFLWQSAPRRSDYARKYEELMVEVENSHNTPKEENSIPEEKICPRCGNKLVLRMATRGENAGNQFYGCSNYPKCRYIKNL